MKLTVSTHTAFGHRESLRTTKQFAQRAIPIVNRAVPGSMPDVQIVLTNARSLAELSVAAEAALVGGADRRALAKAVREANRHARDAAGRAVPLADGGALILVNLDQHRTPADFAITLVHELVHAMQFSRRGVRERVIADVRDELGIKRQSHRQKRESARALERDEDEAYEREYLADQLVPGATA
ncbi:hypothetical protein [Streptomyces sp. PH10-H1]|uniref:hypothetical protein n=1 Tax=Streptomyces sp. PH10-H1 TaxID=3046212 RepID=UPI0024B928A1|nr:hypothetical protein [Streptomyces sp. PH10-H1]MDJ0346267.1 hypothetical protein [Streptomyces sp. PH10-H1]